ncbi:g2022 [Coccomyxa viridis]|uniref:G2022 protein n=1 Tax=Coccomyxa viridis TaxID=1274662 RepID=A0ABP1FMB3_9CHLO
MEVLRSVSKHLARTAVVADGKSYRYKDILGRAQQTAETVRAFLSSNTNGTRGSPVGPCFAIMAPPGPQYVAATWASWLTGGVAVPLCLTHPAGELQYVLEDAKVSAVLTTHEHVATVTPLADKAGAKVLRIAESSQDAHEAQDLSSGLKPEQGALVVYTSGTTGRPKGALHTHSSLGAQIHALVTSWEWQPEDQILHCLPLHHVHGIINALYCAHAVGATVEFQPKFSPKAVWTALTREDDPVTVFMGVPTMYSHLLSFYDDMRSEDQEVARRATQRLRLTVSGSAACPLPIMQRWHALSGQWLLERYGMTETNMILSNPYSGERRAGFVGLPLPDVQVKAVPEDRAEASHDSGSQSETGELCVKGPNVFKEYLNKPEATAKAFDSEGWFRTGDIASLEGDPPYWRIVGRASVDIIKSRGYKISAPQIEDVILAHPGIAECAVMGAPDEALGEAVAAVIACKSKQVSLEELREWLAGKLPEYQLPSRMEVVENIPRNAMGKVNKKQLRKDFFGA